MSLSMKSCIEELYKTFGKHPGNPQMEGSPVYDDLEEWNAALYGKPLRKLTDDDLFAFVGKAMTTWGTVDDYKHFLPRVLELTAQFLVPYEIWVVFEKLEYGKWEEWDPNEQDTILNFMLALWSDLLTNDSEEASIFFADYFSTLAHFYPDFTELLQLWRESKSEAAINHLIHFLSDCGLELFEEGKIKSQSENSEEFIGWLLSEKRLRPEEYPNENWVQLLERYRR